MKHPRSKGKPKPDSGATTPAISTALKTEHSVDILTQIVTRLTEQRNQITTTLQTMAGDIARLELLRDMVRKETQLRNESMSRSLPYTT